MRPPRVLVVDDEEPQRRLFHRFLSTHGFRSAEAASVPEAVSLIRSFRPQLVLSDIALPGVSGIRLLELLRRFPETAHLPVILMTGLPVPSDMVAATAKGLDMGSIFVKGGDMLELTRRMMSSMSSDSLHAPGDLCRGALRVNLYTHQASFGDQLLRLHGWRSFELLCELMRQPGMVERETLHRTIWSSSDNPGIVNVNIMRLRHELAIFPSIRVVSEASGYRLVVD